MELYVIVLSTSDLWLLGICGTLGMAWITYRLSLNLQKRKSFSAAAVIFRNKILTAIEELYPVTLHWDRDIFPRFYQSISRIEGAAAEFRPYVKRKTEFSLAISEYNEYCRKITYENVAADNMYPSMRKAGDVGPRKKFKNIVEHLLSFSEKK